MRFSKVEMNILAKRMERKHDQRKQIGMRGGRPASRKHGSKQVVGDDAGKVAWTPCCGGPSDPAGGIVSGTCHKEENLH